MRIGVVLGGGWFKDWRRKGGGWDLGMWEERRRKGGGWDLGMWEERGRMGVRMEEWEEGGGLRIWKEKEVK